ncbi:MAG TPA: PilZ domain-containing protein [Terriglobales bacterium]|nr:PilZ domain-containing protein [Terriglobales bacterium]
MSQLNALVLTRDPRSTARLLAPLHQWGVLAEVESEPDYAIAALLRRHFDGFIADFASVPSVTDAITAIRSATACKSTPILALVDDSINVQSALEGGANSALNKGSSPARSRPYLRIALLLMTREHLRYFRYPVDTPAAITYAGGATLEARTVNVSNEGLALRLTHPMRVTRTVRARFQLPTANPTVVVATGHTAWMDNQGRLGLRFLYMPEPSRNRFQQYMAEMHSRAGNHLTRHCS